MKIQQDILKPINYSLMSVYHLNTSSMPNIMQKTLKGSVKFEGISLHEGRSVSLEIAAGSMGSGIIFIRTDLKEDNEIKATWNKVSSRPFCTVIENEKGISVSTIEHVMAALAACEIDNARVYVSGPEVPVLDGSSTCFVSALQKAGTIEQSMARSYCVILKTVRLETAWGFVELSPSSSFILDIETTFEHRKNMPPQQHVFRMGHDDFARDIAPARTFGFFEDVEKMQANGFAKGGSLENAVVVKEGTVLNHGGLRFPNECVRHKILDAIGDLYLAGAPLIGKYSARNGGHELNNSLLKAVFMDTTNYRLDTLEPINENKWEPSMRSSILSFGLF